MKRITRHYLIPHEHNNFRSKLLHNSSLVVLVLFLLFTSVSFHILQQNKPEVLGVAYSINQQELLEYTNNARRENGLEPLVLNETLVSAANGKAQHMFTNNYWAHFAPDGTSPWSFIRGAGYNYVFAGENLAKGFTDSRSVVDAWMNSPSHRENLLSLKYKEIGFAISEGSIDGTETVLVVQIFGAQDVPVPTEQKIAVAPTTTVDPAVLPTSIPTILPTLGISPTAIPASNTALIQNPTVAYEEDTQLVVNNAPRITPSFLQLSVENNPFFDVSNINRLIPSFVVGVLLVALVLDFVIIKRKKIPRLVGHNLDHIMILGMFLLLLILQRFGSIL
jgi:uncharacterized protein YkwD